MKAKIDELATNRQTKKKKIKDLYKGINDFKPGYQPRNNLIKDEKGDLVTDYHSIVARWRKYLSAVQCTWG